jgi:hypothetical protein
MINDEKAGMAFIYSTINAASKCPQITVHTVCQSSPSPISSFEERVPQGAHVSHITVSDSEHGHSKSSNESTTSKVSQDVHIVRTHELRIFLF